MPLFDKDELITRTVKARYIHGSGLVPKGNKGDRFEEKSGYLYITKKRLVFEYVEESFFTRKTGTLVEIQLKDICNMDFNRDTFRHILVVEFKRGSDVIQRAEFVVNSPQALINEIIENRSNLT